jgi:hypothetical protein
MTNNKQQTEINAVEYLDKVNQFAKENNTDKPRQQTAVEWFHQKTWALKIQLEKGEISIGEYANTYATLYEQAKEMEKEQRSIKLPSDEEIEDASLEENNDDLSPAEEFQSGAKWMRDKIQGGEQ